MISILIYIIFALLFCFSIALEIFVKNKLINRIVFIILISLYFFLGIFKSDSVGTDSITYSQIYYNQATSVSFITFLKNGSPEFIYNGLMFLFANAGINKIFFDIILFAIISVSIYFSFYKLEKPVFTLSIFFFLGFFGMSFTGIRQAVAIAICTLATIFVLTENIRNRIIRYVIFYCLIIVSIGFHKTAVIMCFLPLVLLIPVNKNILLFISPVVIPLSILFPRMYLLFGVMLNEYYLPYTSRISFTFLVAVVLLFVFSAVFYEPFENFFAKIRYKCEEFDKTKKALYLLLFITIILLAFNTVSMSVPRMAMYLYLPFSLCVFYLLKGFSNRIVSIILIFVVEICFCVFFIKNLTMWGIVPYEFRF